MKGEENDRRRKNASGSIPVFGDQRLCQRHRYGSCRTKTADTGKVRSQMADPLFPKDQDQ